MGFAWSMILGVCQAFLGGAGFAACSDAGWVATVLPSTGADAVDVDVVKVVDGDALSFVV